VNYTDCGLQMTSLTTIRIKMT